MRALAVLLFALAMTTSRSTAADTRECVVLLHGVALSGWAMRPLERALERDGYRAINLSYPSRHVAIDELGTRWLPEQLRAAGVAEAPRVHFVAHSMGNLVVRFFLREHRPQNLGRVVMVGPPNHGSAAADAAARWAVARRVMGVNLARLGTGEHGAAQGLGPADFEVGVIAGTRSIHGLFAGALAGEHDGVVSVESARLEGMSDFVVVPHSHTVMLWRRAVIDQVRAFLRDGRFTR